MFKSTKSKASNHFVDKKNDIIYKLLIQGDVFSNNNYCNLDNFSKLIFLIRNYETKTTDLYCYALNFPKTYIEYDKNYNYYLCQIDKDNNILLGSNIVVQKIKEYIKYDQSCLKDFGITLNTYPSNDYFNENNLNLESNDIANLFMTFLELKIDIYTFVVVFYLLEKIVSKLGKKLTNSMESLDKIVNKVINEHKDRKIIRLLLLLSEYQQKLLNEYYKYLLTLNDIYGKGDPYFIDLKYKRITDDTNKYNEILRSSDNTVNKLYEFLRINAGKYFPQQERKKYQPNKTTLTRSMIVKSAKKTTLKKQKRSSSSNNLFPL